MSRIVDILKGTYTDEPQSRNEAILLGHELEPSTRAETYFKALYNNVPCDLVPETRIESIIDAILNGYIYSNIISAAFTNRVTANGTDIIDGAKAEIQTIEGATVVNNNQLYNSKVTSLLSKDSNGNVKDTLTLNKELGSWHDIIINDGSHEGITTSHVEDSNFGEYIIRSNDSFQIEETLCRISNLNLTGVARYSGDYILNGLIPETNYAGVYNNDNSFGLSGSEINNILIHDSTCTTVEDFKGKYIGKKVRYRTTTHEYTPININTFNAYNQGSEAIESDTEQYGAIATIDIKYMYSDIELQYQSEIEQTLIEEAVRWTT